MIIKDKIQNLITLYYLSLDFCGSYPALPPSSRSENEVHYVWSKMLIKLIGCMTRFGPNIPEVGQQWCQHSNWCLIMLIQYPVVVVSNIFMWPIKQISIWSLTSCIMMVSLSFADCCAGNIPNIGEESEKFVLLETPLVLNIVILPIKWISALWQTLWVD